MIIFLYLSLLTLKPSSPSSSSEISLPIPAPRAVISVPISIDDKTFDNGEPYVLYEGVNNRVNGKLLIKGEK